MPPVQRLVCSQDRRRCTRGRRVAFRRALVGSDVARYVGFAREAGSTGLTTYRSHHQHYAATAALDGRSFQWMGASLTRWVEFGEEFGRRACTLGPIGIHSFSSRTTCCQQGFATGSWLALVRTSLAFLRETLRRRNGVSSVSFRMPWPILAATVSQPFCEKGVIE